MTTWLSARFAACLALICTLSGCMSFPMPGWLDQALLARKPSSIAGWQDEKSGRGFTLRATELRTALLLTGWADITLKTVRGYRGATVCEIDLSGPDGGKIGSAVPVTRDGYFLTAAHCVADRQPLTVVALSHDLRLVKAPARVVWTGEMNRGGPDLALIHAPLALARPFALADAAALRPGDPVALAGWSKLGFKNSNGMAAGRIVAVSRLHHQASGVTWRLIEHDAPFNSGDSGGPLVTMDGSLAGINAQAVPTPVTFLRVLTGDGDAKNRPLAGYTARSFAPDREWLRRTIEADRRAQKEPVSPTHFSTR